ncbi:MAG: MFS transporter [Bacteroidetes bacterium]|nr:MFS transporter [Bacteroidota bacterium]
MSENIKKEQVFTKYEMFLIAILAFLQFTIILDFMVLSPLSAILLPELDITPAQFSLVVSVYAISAGLSGLLAAGFADKYDRKKLLLFFYTGFIIGTFLCGFAPDYNSLLIARVVTGIFGGVIGAIIFAITTDVFQLQVRGRVMGFIQMAFAASQVLGIPVGLYLANKTNWHSPFILIASISVIVYVIIILKVKPVADHLKLKKNITSFQHFKQTISKKRYITGFAATTLLATGGFMLMPFGSAFTVNNLKIELDHLPIIYVITGLFTIVAGPIIGRLSDRVGKYNMFIAGSILSMIMVLIYCNLGATPLWAVIMINVILFIGITSRIISASALMSAVPEPADRGAFMGINASVQQFSGGIAAFFAGLIVVQEDSGYLDHYDWLGYVVVVAMIITVFMLSFINKMVTNKEEAKLGKWKT